jgi:hypothetical protein
MSTLGGSRDRLTGGRLFSGLLLVLFVLSWASFPFFLDRVFPYLTEIMFVIVWASILLLGVITGHPRGFDWSSGYVRAFLLGYGVFLLGLLVATLMNLDAGSSYQLGVVLLKFIFLLFLLLWMDRASVEKLFDFYSNAMLFFAFVAVVVSLVLAVAPSEPLSAIEVGIQGNSMIFLQNYGAAFVLSPISNFCPDLYRIQSFSDEPGTLGTALLPAIFWLGLARRSIWRTGALLGSLLLTFSAGAWIGLALVGPVVMIFWRQCLLSTVRERRVAFVVITATLGLLTLLMLLLIRTECAPPAAVVPPDVEPPTSQGAANPEPPDSERPNQEDLSQYAYSQQRVSSLGKRLDQAAAVGGLLVANPEGVGAGQSSSRIGQSVAIGYLNVVLESGVLGGAGYTIALLTLLAIAARSVVRSEDPVRAAIGASVMAMIFMSLLRTRADASFWHMFLLASLLVTCFGRWMPGNKSRRDELADHPRG